MANENKAWNFFENFYKNSIQGGETFSLEISEEIQNEMEKMAEEYNKWLKQKENETGTISESIGNQ